MSLRRRCAAAAAARELRGSARIASPAHRIMSHRRPASILKYGFWRNPVTVLAAAQHQQRQSQGIVAAGVARRRAKCRRPTFARLADRRASGGGRDVVELHVAHADRTGGLVAACVLEPARRVCRRPIFVISSTQHRRRGTMRVSTHWTRALQVAACALAMAAGSAAGAMDSGQLPQSFTPTMKAHTGRVGTGADGGGVLGNRY
ncbi:MAG TPA: hypothetical protein VMU00_01645, partial [Steroidobacteraceae bacterium]|nr:hypothetical protein [Steroidobacteraceae bacterium]